VDATTVLELITKHQQNTNNKCGVPVPLILIECATSYELLKPILNSLFTEKKIKVREGINGKLIFLR